MYDRGCKWLEQAHSHKHEITKRAEDKEMQECTFAPTFYTRNSSYWKKPRSQLRSKKENGASETVGKRAEGSVKAELDYEDL